MQGGLDGAAAFHDSFFRHHVHPRVAVVLSVSLHIAPAACWRRLLRSYHLLGAAPSHSMVDSSKIELKPWDLPLLRQFDGFPEFMRYVDHIVLENEMAFIPTIHQFVDALWPTSSQCTHNNRVRRIYWISNHLKDFYKTIRIPKRDGTYRTLQVPSNELKYIQRWILHNVLSKYPVSNYATAYKPGASVLKNAEPHVGKDVVLKLDIKSFFSSIEYGMLFPWLFDIYPKPMKHLLVHLCCYPLDDAKYGDMCLPQGAPTSPHIANIYMRGFDNYIGEYCRRHNISYTRYADDMTFSGAFDPDAVIEKVKRALDPRLRLNETKTQIIYKGRRQIVTGVVVNETPHTPSEYRRKIRQEMYYCRKFGIESHIMYAGHKKYFGMSQPADMGLVEKLTYLRNLEGRINYVLSIDPDDTQMLKYREEVRLWQNRIGSGADLHSQ